MDDRADSYIREVERTVGQRVHAAAIHLQGVIRQMISTPSRTVGQREITRGKNKGKMKQVLGRRGSNRSKPDEPPHKDFGTLRRSIAVDFDAANLRARVGSNLPVSRFLELGTRRLAARPFLRKALVEQQAKIEQIIRGT